MNCLAPLRLKNEKYGLLPNEPEFYDVPCGKCEACLRRYQSTWFTRLKFHQEESYFSCFVTLTYDDQHLPEGFNVCKKDVQDFHKRLRSKLSKPQDFKYFLTSEYGPEGLRPHYHAIYFGISTDEWSKIQEAWQNGFVMVEKVTDGRLRYVTGYIIEKLFVPDGREPLFNLISKKLGASYVEKYRDWHNDLSILQRSYVPYHGIKLPLPRYYKEKLYSPYQRKVYAKKLSQDADEKFRERVEDIGLDKLLRAVRSDTRAYVEKVRKTHKKKKL